MDNIALPSNLSAFPAMVWAWSVAFLPRLVVALIVLAVGILLAKWVKRLIVGFGGSAAHLDATVRPVLASVVSYAILVLTIIAALGQLGVQTASLLAVLGAAGLAIGLALQGTLTNIAAGVMLLWLRPFRVGDYIELASSNVAGTVDEMGLFACRLTGFDGLVVFAPNSTLWNVALRNHSRAGARLVAYQVTFPGGTDISATRSRLVEATRSIDGIRREPEPEATVDKFSSTSLVVLCRFWTESHQAGTALRSWPNAVMQAFSATDANRPSEIVRVLPGDTDPSRLGAIA